MNKYLINEPPLLVLPTLAKGAGLNEAIMLQQIHYFIGKSKHESGGFRWIYNTYADWLEIFPFWSIRTLKRIVKSLEDSELIYTTTEFNYGLDNKKWFRINYTKLEEMTGSSRSSESIIHEYPILFQPSLAVKHGLNEAIFLQQLHYWLHYGNPQQQDSVLWVVSSYKNWLKQFQFWSEDTLYRVIKRLTDLCLIISESKYNNSAINKTKWLTINYSALYEGSAPQVGTITPQVGTITPQVGTITPQVGTITPQVGTITPQVGTITPQVGTITPQVGTITPQVGTSESASWHDDTRKLSPSLLYTETNTETNTERERERKVGQDDADRVEKVNAVQKRLDVGVSNNMPSEAQNALLSENKNNSDSLLLEYDETALKAKMKSLFDIGFEMYKDLVNVGAVKRYNQHLYEHILKAYYAYGDSVIEQIFTSVKKSDFLLTLKKDGFPKYSWLLKNAEAIISGKYDSDGKSLYETAQDCSLKEQCNVLNGGASAHLYCRYCDKYKSFNTEPKKEKTLTEIAVECASNQVCPGKRFNIYFDYCKECPKHERIESVKTRENLEKEARECFSKCKGMCAPRIMKTGLKDCCAYCFEGKPDKENIKNRKKTSESNTQSDILDGISHNSPSTVWSAAYRLVEINKFKLKNIIKEHMPYSVYSEADFLNDAVILAYSVLYELAAESEKVDISKAESRLIVTFESQIWENQSIPALANVLKTENKSPCVFDNIEEHHIAAEDVKFDASTLSVSEDIIKLLLGILSIRQEQVMLYRLGLTRRGSLSLSECALIMGCTKRNVLNIQESALKILSNFISAHEISRDTEFNDVAKFVRAYQEKNFNLKFNGYFELGNILSA